MRKLLRIGSFLALALGLTAAEATAQAGKIAGTVVDATTGEALPGVNVLIDGTTQGAITDIEGYYVILNVRPGTYAVRASYIGYTPVVQEDVRVNIDLTATVDFQLREETVGMDELVVTAERPVVQRDVSASVANIGSAEIENLPVTDVEKVIGLQAGFERGLSIRGAGGSQVQFAVDGFSTQGGIDNIPFTGVSYTAVEEVSVQTGGFSAKYGNVRSGLVNVVTKDPPRNRYTADAIVRYSPPSQKYFSAFTIEGEEVELPNDPMAYFTRPYFDPAVANEGTDNGAWDQYLKDSYPSFSQGWNSLASAYSEAEGVTVTPAQMQEAYQWYLRKDFEIDTPDYEVDATFGGPVPGISRYLGDLRFIASYRQEEEAYIVPMIRDTYRERTAQWKVISDVAPGMKLTLNGLWGKQYGINATETGRQNMFNGDMPYFPWDNNPWDTSRYLASAIGGNHIFATHYRNPMDVTHLTYGAQFTHTLSSRTFYEVQLQRQATDYLTFADEERDYSTINTVGPIELSEEPFGWEWRDKFDILGVGLRTGGHWFSARDSTETSRWSARFDLTSQINRYLQLETGFEYIYNNYDVAYREVDPAHPHHTNPIHDWERTPRQGAAYGQTKLEFKGMVANLGLRLDYYNPSGSWYAFSPFDRALSAQVGRDEIDEVLDQNPVDKQFALSPRLGVSFPITETSKLFFNYGHFREAPRPLDIFNIEEINTGAVNFIGNPDLPLQKTVQYELGYEQSFADQYLVRLSGYYKDLSEQGRSVRFTSIDGEVNYATIFPYNYGDIRGAELTVYKNRGDWVRGFINYTYLSWKNGNFGFSQVNENRVTQRQYLLTTTDHYQSTPIPEPFARFNIEVLVPETIGPEVAGFHPLGDWRVNFLGEWRQGQTLTFTGQGLEGGRASVRELQGNVKTRDFYTLDMRFSKNFDTRVGEAQFFVDLTNVLNLRHMYTYGGGRDQERYLRSLRLPEDTFEGNADGKPSSYQLIPGSDRVGDFREPGAPFVPVEVVDALPEEGHTLAYDLGGYAPHNSPLYYVPNTCGEGDPYCGGTYYQWDGSGFVEASGSFLDKVEDDKAYIDMPNQLYNTFLNPRNVFFGLRLKF